VNPAAGTLFGPDLSADEAFARALDEADPLAEFRTRFELPVGDDGAPAVYLAGNSLGPLPRAARRAVETELTRWSRRGVDGWFDDDGWYGIDERFLPPLAALVGAACSEVAVLNGLTVNLHLLIASFFRPAGERRGILVDAPCFPSDRFAVETQLRWHGLDPAVALLEVGAERGDGADEEAIERVLAERGGEIALALVGGVNFLTGRRLDLARLARAARAAGAVLGVDLAHAVGNVPLRLHEWDVDFAAWCHYKYANAGPGAPAGIFVHERHAGRRETPRLGGWWGNDPRTRFRMQLDPRFRPRADAAGWQLSCPPALAMAPLGPALALFEEAGLEALRAKSVRLTAYLEWLLRRRPAGSVELLTPADPERRGAQLSLRVRGDARALQARLQRAGVVGDFRAPDVLRLAPAPLFNGFHDAWRAAEAIAALADDAGRPSAAAGAEEGSRA
jgi:kynureninase